MRTMRIMMAALLGLGAWTAGARERAPDRVGCRVELDRTVLPVGANQRAVIKVTLEAPRPPERDARPPVNLTVVLDRSGSMGGEKLEKAKEAAIAALRRLGERDRFALVIYDHNVETLVPAQSASNAEWIEGRIRNIQAGGNTALYGGVSQGAAEVRKHIEDRYVHRIILLSDGLANVGPSQPSDLERLGHSLMKESISVTTVGVGTDYNEDLMTRLSQASDGNAYFVEDSRDLPRIFAKELGDVLSVVAHRVVLEIECPKGVRPLRVIGRDARISDNRVELQLNQLYGGQEKYALIEVEVPAGQEDDVREIAEARCVYDSVLTQQQERSEGRVSARFSGNLEKVSESVNQAVQQEFTYNVIAEAKDKAVELVDQGRNEEAAKMLRATNASLKQQAEEYGYADDMQPLFKQVESDASTVEQKGLDKRGRKSFRTDSYTTRNQQKQ